MQRFEIGASGKDLNGNRYIDIDDDSSNNVAVVYLTEHNDFVIHLSHTQDKNAEGLEEAIHEAKHILSSLKYQGLDEKLVSLLQEDEYNILKSAEGYPYVLRKCGDGATVLEMSVDASIYVAAAIAETVFPSYLIKKIQKEYECDSLAEAIECGADFEIFFEYHIDYYTDELTLEVAKESEDRTLCDCVSIKCSYKFEDYSLNPNNQKWFRNFVNEELKKLGKPTAREVIKQYSDKKEREPIEK